MSTTETIISTFDTTVWPSTKELKESLLIVIDEHTKRGWQLVSTVNVGGVLLMFYTKDNKEEVTLGGATTAVVPILADGGEQLAYVLDRIKGCGTELLTSFDRACEEEAEELIRTRGGRKTARRKSRAYHHAARTYGSLVYRYLRDPAHVLTAVEVLSFRCKAKAWAIAQMIIMLEE